ncbi:hypothetical protein GGF46_003918 [Coemansia sp. RSA 552]|nr:hypothetical protein GGF46_003918 [Coemansia sp. RSA 552]
MRWSWLNRYLLLLLFNVLNVVAFGAIVAVAVANIIKSGAPTNLLIYYGYTGLLSLALLVSELRAPRLLNAQARFLFTYTGRGVVLTYFGCIVYTTHLLNVVACIYTVSLGVVYFVVAWVPFVSMQNGLLYNWRRWSRGASEESSETASEVDLPKTVHLDQVPGDAVPLYSTPAANGLNPAYAARHASVQSIVWPEPQVTGYGGEKAAGHQSNSSFVYGLTVEARRPESTGDALLDSIVNSSRFAREVMDVPDDGANIAVRPSPPPSSSSQGFGLAASEIDDVHASRQPAPHCRPRSFAALPISSPIPYHVFAPGSREALEENMAHVNQALADQGPSHPLHR